jgi:FkbM family methyltransferase
MSEAFLVDLVRPGAIVIDVGANVGDTAVELAAAVGPSGRVVAVEPAPGPFTVLVKRTRDLGQVTPIRCALGRRHETRAVFHYRHWTLLTQAAEDPRMRQPNYHPGEYTELKGRFECAFTRLDTLCLDFGLPRVDFIKIDVDGFEYQVIQGATTTLRQHHPILHVEVGRWTMGQVGDAPEPLLLSLAHLGYSFARVEPDRVIPCALPEAIATIPEGEACVNLLCADLSVTDSFARYREGAHAKSG